jgi:hypothetical protein
MPVDGLLTIRRHAAHTKGRTGTHTMPYTLAAAAMAAGVNKTTILRAIKSGKVSGSKDEHGQWHVEPAELHRVYPPVASRADGSDAVQRDASLDAVAAAELRIKATLAECRLSDFKAALDDMRSQRDAWQLQAERLALTDQRAHRPWWRWRAV